MRLFGYVIIIGDDEHEIERGNEWGG